MRKIYLTAGIVIGIALTMGTVVEAAFAPISIPAGGTATTTAPAGQVIYGGSSAYQSIATTTVSCSGSASCTSFTVLGSSPITISASGGSGGSGTVGTSTNETAGQLPYWTTTSATPALLGKVATTTFTPSSFPANLSGTLGTLVGGTNSTWTYWGLATTSQPSSSNLLTSNGGAGVYGTATSSLAVGTGLTNSGTLGALVSGSAASISFAAIAANSLWANLTGASAVPTVIATSSLFTFPWSIANGGTNATAQTTNGVNYYDSTKITSGTGFIFDGTNVGISTTSPHAVLGVHAKGTSSTKNILELSYATGGAADSATTTVLTVASSTVPTFLVGTTTPFGAATANAYTLTAGGTGTTTLNIGEVGGTGKTCINMQSDSGAIFQLYIHGSSLTVVSGSCTQ